MYGICILAAVAAFTAGPSEGLEEIDSDVDPETCVTDVFTLHRGQRILCVDVGVCP